MASIGKTAIQSAFGVAALALLPGCPYDAAAAGLVVGDGGWYVPLQASDAAGLPEPVDASVPELLASPPSMDALCTLYIGDMSDQTDYPKELGTWIGDVKRIIGEPPRNGQSYGEKDAHLDYLWRGSKGEPAGISLSFEYLLLNNNAPPESPEAWKQFKQSYWLNGIQMRDGSFYDCWRWQLLRPGLTPCPNCVGWTEVSNTCLAGASNPTDCFR